jgi:antitoxin HicB
MTKIFDYAVAVRPLPAHEGGGFSALVPDLPGCMSDGETPQEAFLNAQDAIACWIEAAQELDRPIPAPTTPDPVMTLRAG